MKQLTLLVLVEQQSGELGLRRPYAGKKTLLVEQHKERRLQFTNKYFVIFIEQQV